MDEATIKYFEDDKNVYKELGEARQAFKKGTTFEQYDNLIKGLTIMSLYCSEGVLHMVHATIDEAMTRQAYAITMR